MATVTSAREPHPSDKRRPSAPSSRTSSIADHSDAHPVSTQSSLAVTSNPESVNGHGLATPPPEPHKSAAPATAEKPSMTKRLTRMFSTKDVAKSERSEHAHNPPTSLTASPNPDLEYPSKPASPNPSNTPSRKASTTERPKMDKSEKSDKAITNATRDNKKAPVTHQRYVVDAELPGGHSHHLKSAKRQEKLTDMLRGMLSGRKNGEVAEGGQDLSLMHSWMDQLKNERGKEALASDKKGGPNSTASLVEKYGKCQEIVGRGAFGIVRISHKRLDTGEQLFAVKEFKRRPDENEKKYSKRLTSEFCISSALRHPNVIHTLDLLQDAKGDYCEVMEFCAGGDLYTLVLAAGKLEVNEADCYFKQMMRGVEYMHEMGVAHRDLKPENLLLTTHGALKITDFGNGECFRMAWEKETHMVSGLCGSAPYIAPEEYVDKEFDARAVDVWACGVIYMAMRTGRHLWRVAKKDEDEFYQRYLEGRKDEDGYAPIESLNRARCRNVIYSILDPNPGRRITASQTLRSEWGREIKLCKAGEEGF